MKDIFKEKRKKNVIEDVVKAYSHNYGALYENSVSCMECRYKEFCNSELTCAENINNYIEGKWEHVLR